ncbi:MAG: pilY1-2 [Acidobacteriales bacterium]|nr:pilY1-2 [Terriglobales bacterium]
MKYCPSLFLAASFCTFVAGCGSSMSPAPQSVTQQNNQPSKPPVVISTTQQSSANHRVFVAFSHAMDASTINSENLSINGVSSTVSYDAKNKIAYMSPSTQLSNGTVYTAKVSNAVRDTKGMNLAANYNFAIFTAPVVDTTAPTIIGFDTGCVATGGPVHVTFSEAMDSSTITASSFFVLGTTGSVSYDPITHIASYTPSSPLTAGATYFVSVNASVTDLAGNHLSLGNGSGQEFQWQITVCNTPPPGNFCSYTKGGYAGPGAPGQLLDNNYTSVFSSGLTIGINDDSGPQHHDIWTADSTGLLSLKTFLTSPAGGASGALTADATNPVATGSGNLPEQVAALTINVGLSGVSGDPAGFGNLVLHDTGGSLDGSTVAEILAAVNSALAGNGLPSGYTFDTLNDLITNLNESWDNCQQSTWGAAHLSVAVD